MGLWVHDNYWVTQGTARSIMKAAGTLFIRRKFFCKTFLLDLTLRRQLGSTHSHICTQVSKAFTRKQCLTSSPCLLHRVAATMVEPSESGGRFGSASRVSPPTPHHDRLLQTCCTLFCARFI